MQLHMYAICRIMVARFHTLTVTEYARIMRAFRFPQNNLPATPATHRAQSDC